LIALLGTGLGFASFLVMFVHEDVRCWSTATSAGCSSDVVTPIEAIATMIAAACALSLSIILTTRRAGGDTDDRLTALHASPARLGTWGRIARVLVAGNAVGATGLSVYLAWDWIKPPDLRCSSCGGGQWSWPTAAFVAVVVATA